MPPAWPGVLSIASLCRGRILRPAPPAAAGGPREAVPGLVPAQRRADQLDQRQPRGQADQQEVDRHPRDRPGEIPPAAAGAADAIAEAAEAGVTTIFCITEGIPVHDMVGALASVREHGARLIGPNCPGATSPGANGRGTKVGIIPASIHLPGDVGVVSRSGTLTYEAVQSMTDAGIGQSTCLGIGGDPIIGTTFRDALELFAADAATRAIVLIGEIGGAAEEEAAAWAAANLPHLPRVAFIAGRAAPEGRRMGHAGAIVSGASGRAIDKIAALEAAGFKVAGSPTELPGLLLQAGYSPR